MSARDQASTALDPPGYVVVYDDSTRGEAEDLVRSFALEPRHLANLAARSLARTEQLIVDIDLLSLRSVQLFRLVIGKAPPAKRNWAFKIEGGAHRHASSVQADALGATWHFGADGSLLSLRQMLSIAEQPPLSAARTASLERSPGGAAILAAGHELARLFGGLSANQAISLEAVAAVSADIVKSVDLVGADAWLSSVRTHHEGTFQHCLLVTGTVASFVTQSAASEAVAVRLTKAALLHDIGKAAVPLHILDKAGRLNEQEFSAIRLHPREGFQYLSEQRRPDPQVLDAVLHHHEALDGSGYPDGLRGDQIPVMTRILTVCDIFAALVEARSYKPAMAPERAITILTEMALGGKVDYPIVRDLARAFGMQPPETIREVLRNLADGRARA